MRVAAAVGLALCGCSHRVAAITRKYYVAASEVLWDYAPSGRNQFDDTSARLGGAAVFLRDTPFTIGKEYLKAVYEEYTDDTFTTKVTKPKWLGNVGPILRAEVGDTLEIHFFNNASVPYSMHPHGVLYDHASEGVNYKLSVGTGGSVAPGGKFTYTWEVPARAGPAAADGNSVMWAYHSHTDEVLDVYSGLAGPLIVYKEGTLDADTGLPTDVDKEFVLIFMVTDENNSHYLDDNCQRSGCDPEAEIFEESNLMHGINGRMYGNLPGLEMDEGDTVRWYLGAFGTEVDLHSAHIHGSVFTWDSHKVDVIELIPATFRVAEMEADNPGTWLIHCHVADHIAAGMLTYYTVNPTQQPALPASASP